MKFRTFILSALLAMSYAGCVTPPPPPMPPTLPLTEVITRINQNNHRIPTLYASLEFDGQLVDVETKKSHTVFSQTGNLLYKRPMGMHMRATRPGITLFEMGSTEEHYWLKIPERDTMWWGLQKNLGKPCVDEQLMPIRPDLLLEVLGLGTFGTDLRALPAPTMRVNPDAKVYMFVWTTELPDRWWAQREVWYDMESLLPTKVILFDKEGRPVLRANLSGHAPVRIDDTPEKDWPKMASVFDMYFPESGSKIKITLTNRVLDRDGVPSERGIRFPNPQRAGVPNVIQVDEACNDE